jgi:hypothetical protein
MVVTFLWSVNDILTRWCGLNELTGRTIVRPSHRQVCTAKSLYLVVLSPSLAKTRGSDAWSAFAPPSVLGYLMGTEFQTARVQPVRLCSQVM